MSKLELINLSKMYGEVLAVDSVNFSCESGEFIALLGPSGCGKSSTMRMIAGLEEISDGDVKLNGKVVNLLPPRDRNVALAFESYALYSPLTVYENLALPLKKNFSSDEIKNKVYKIAERFELGELLERKPSGLSGGQSQRVSLARALIREPSVLLLDEPLSHLDQRLRSIIRARIRNIHDTLKKTTTIYVTHDQDEAVALADRIIVMNDRNFQQIGTVKQLWDHPANVFVGGFLGDPPMNFFDALVKDEKIFLQNGKSIEVKLSSKLERDLVVGVRPDWIEITEFGSNDAAVTGEVAINEFQGDRCILTVKSEVGTLKVIADAGREFTRKDKIGIKLNPKKMSLFLRDTQISIFN